MDPLKGLKDIFSIVLFIVIVSAIGIVYKNYQTKQELQGTIATQQKVIEIVDNSNIVLAGALETKNNSDKASTATVVEVTEKKEEAVKVQEEIKTNTVKKVTVIKKKFEEKIAASTDGNKTAELVNERSQEISKARITALWQDYCKYEQDDTCKGLT